MQIGKRLAAASAIGTLAGGCGRQQRGGAAAEGRRRSRAWRRPRRRRRRRCRRSSTACRRPCSRRARRTGSTTSCGSSSTSTPTSTALKDRVHVDVSRPRETDSDGLKVPVIFEDSPYYAGGANVINWAVDHELGVPPATRIRAPLHRRRAHKPDDLHDLREHVGAARLRRRALRVARHGQLDRLPELRRADRDARRDCGHRLAQRPPQGLHDQGRHDRGHRGHWHNGNSGDDGHVLQRHDPDRGRVDRRRGPEGDRPDLRDLRLVRLLPRQRHDPRARRLPGRGPRRPHRVHLLAQRRGPAPHDLLADDPGRRRQAGPRVRQPERVLGRPQLHAGDPPARSRPRRSSPTATATTTS